MSFTSFSPRKNFLRNPEASCKKRALVVDDSTTILHAICSLLEHHEIVEIVGRAESGAETIAAVSSLDPELILLDADMPGMSGVHTALVLSQTVPWIKVVLMSMDVTPQFRQTCAASGAYAVIYKPKFLRELTRILEQGPEPAWKKSFPRHGSKQTTQQGAMPDTIMKK